VAVDLAANHVATSLLSLIEWWLDNTMSPPPEQMGKVYKSMIIDSTVGALSTLSPGMTRDRFDPPVDDPPGMSKSGREGRMDA
jgi:hypothetical protein